MRLISPASWSVIRASPSSCRTPAVRFHISRALDKNGNGAKLPELPSTYLKRMYTDVVSPHALGIKFAMDFFGIDHIFYGTDYPCWEPLEAMRLFDEVGLDQRLDRRFWARTHVAS